MGRKFKCKLCGYKSECKARMLSHLEVEHKVPPRHMLQYIKLTKKG